MKKFNIYSKIVNILKIRLGINWHQKVASAGTQISQQIKGLTPEGNIMKRLIAAQNKYFFVNTLW